MDSVVRYCVENCTGLQFADGSSMACVDVCPEEEALFGQLETKVCVDDCNETLETYADN